MTVISAIAGLPIDTERMGLLNVNICALSSGTRISFACARAAKVIITPATKKPKSGVHGEERRICMANALMNFAAKIVDRRKGKMKGGMHNSNSGQSVFWNGRDSN